MSLSASRFVATRALARTRTVHQQKRGIIDYLTNYPDKVNEMKKIQCAGGTLQGEKNPTWLKHSSDKIVAGVALVLSAVGVARVGTMQWRLATGKGKLDD